MGSHPPARLARVSLTSWTVVLSVISMLVGSLLTGFFAAALLLGCENVEKGSWGLHTAMGDLKSDWSCHRGVLSKSQVYESLQLAVKSS